MDFKPNAMVAAPRPQAATDKAQPRRLLAALVLLIIALAAVVIRDRQFWFGGDESAEMDGAETQTAQAVTKPVVKTATPAVAAPVKKAASTARTVEESKPADVPTVTGTRTVLPPMDVEVVAGNSHRTVRPGSNATKLEITGPVPTRAAEREVLDATYPLLTQRTKVQGSVVLQALIGPDGVVQNLHVISGPAILSSAAQQAVREWKFKPILQNGQAVESKAMITVNFTIKVADDASNATIAESRPLTIQTLTR